MSLAQPTAMEIVRHSSRPKDIVTPRVSWLIQFLMNEQESFLLKVCHIHYHIHINLAGQVLVK